MHQLGTNQLRIYQKQGQLAPVTRQNDFLPHRHVNFSVDTLDTTIVKMPEKKGTFYGFGSYFGGAGGAGEDTKKKSSKPDMKSPKKSPKKSPSENKNIFHGFGGTFPQKSNNSPAGPSRTNPPLPPQPPQQHRQIITNDRYAQPAPAPDRGVLSRNPKEAAFLASNSKFQPSPQPPLAKGHNGSLAPHMPGNKPSYSTANVAPNSTNHDTNPERFEAGWKNKPRGKEPAQDRGLFSTNNIASVSQPARGLDRTPGNPSGLGNRAVESQRGGPTLRDERLPKSDDLLSRKLPGNSGKNPAAPQALGNIGRDRVGADPTSSDTHSKHGGLFKWDRSKEPKESTGRGRAPPEANVSGKAPDTEFGAAPGRVASAGREVLHPEKQKAVVLDPRVPPPRSQPKDTRLQPDVGPDADKFASPSATLGSRWRKGTGESNDKNVPQNAPANRKLESDQAGTQDRFKDRMFHGLHPPPSRKQDQHLSPAHSASSREDTSFKDGPRPKINERTIGSGQPANPQIKNDATALNSLRSRHNQADDESQQSRDRGRLFDRIRNGGAPNAAERLAQQDQRAGEPSRGDQPLGRKDNTSENSQKDPLRSIPNVVNDRPERQDRKIGKDPIQPLQNLHEDKRKATGPAAAPLPPARPNPELDPVASQKDGSIKGAFWRKKAGEEFVPTKLSQSRGVEARGATPSQVPVAQPLPGNSKATAVEHNHGRHAPSISQSSQVPIKAEAYGSQRLERDTAELQKPKLSTSEKLKLGVFDSEKPDSEKPMRTKDPRVDGKSANQNSKPHDVLPSAGVSKTEAKEEKNVQSTARAVPTRSPLDFLGRRDKKDRKDASKLDEVPQPPYLAKDVRQPAVPDAPGNPKLSDWMKKAPLPQQTRELNTQPQDSLPDHRATKAIHDSSTRSASRDLPLSTGGPEASGKNDPEFSKEQQSFMRDKTQNSSYDSRSGKQQPLQALLKRDAPDAFTPGKLGRREAAPSQDSTQHAKVEVRQSSTVNNDKKRALPDRFAPLRGRNDQPPQDVAPQPSTFPDKPLPALSSREARLESERSEVPQISKSNVKADRLGLVESSKQSENVRDGKPGYLENLSDAARTVAPSASKHKADEQKHGDQKQGQVQPPAPSQSLPGAESSPFPRPLGREGDTGVPKPREDKLSSQQTSWKQVLLPGRSGNGAPGAMPPSPAANESSKDPITSTPSYLVENDIQANLPPVKSSRGPIRELQTSSASIKENRPAEDQRKAGKLHGMLRGKGLDSFDPRRYPANTSDFDESFAGEHRKNSNRPTVSEAKGPDGAEITQRKRDAETPRDTRRRPLNEADQPSTIIPRDIRTGQKQFQSDLRNRGDLTVLPSTQQDPSNQALKESFREESTVAPPLDSARVPQPDVSRTRVDSSFDGTRSEMFNEYKDVKDKRPFFGSRNAQEKFGKDGRTVPTMQINGSIQQPQIALPAPGDSEVRSKPDLRKQPAESTVFLPDRNRGQGAKRTIDDASEQQQKELPSFASRLDPIFNKKSSKQVDSEHGLKSSGAKLEATQADVDHEAPGSVQEAGYDRKDRLRPSNDLPIPAGIPEKDSRTGPGNSQSSFLSSNSRDRSGMPVIPSTADAHKPSFNTTIEEEEWPRPSGSQLRVRDMRQNVERQNAPLPLVGEVQPASLGFNPDESKPRPVPEDWLKSPGITAPNTISAPQQTQKKGWWKNLWGDENVAGQQKPVNSSSYTASDKPTAEVPSRSLQPGVFDAVAQPMQQEEPLSRQRLNLRDGKGSMGPGFSRSDEPDSSEFKAAHHPVPKEGGRHRFQEVSKKDMGGDQHIIDDMVAPLAKNISQNSVDEDASQVGKSRFLPFSSRREPEQKDISNPSIESKPSDGQAAPELKQQVPFSPDFPRAMEVNLVSMPAGTADRPEAPRGKSSNRKSSIYGLKAPVVPENYDAMPSNLRLGVQDQGQTDSKAEHRVLAVPVTPETNNMTDLKPVEPKYVGTENGDTTSVPAQTFGSERGGLAVDGIQKRSGRSSPPLGDTHDIGLSDRRKQLPSFPGETQRTMANKYSSPNESSGLQQDTRFNELRAAQLNDYSMASFASASGSHEYRAADDEISRPWPADSSPQRDAMRESRPNPASKLAPGQVDEPAYTAEQEVLPPLYGTDKPESRYMSQMPAPLRLKTSRTGGKPDGEEAYAFPVSTELRAVDSTPTIPIASGRHRDFNNALSEPAIRSPSDAFDAPGTETKESFGGWFKSKPKKPSISDHRADLKPRSSLDRERDDLPGAVSTLRNSKGKDYEQSEGSQRGKAPQDPGFENNLRSFWSTTDAKKNKTLTSEESAMDSSHFPSHYEVNDRQFYQDGYVEAEYSETMADEGHKPSIFSRILSKKDRKSGDLTGHDISLNQDEQRNSWRIDTRSQPQNAADRVLPTSASATGFPLPPSAANPVEPMTTQNHQVSEYLHKPALATASDHVRAVDGLPPNETSVDDQLFVENACKDDSLDASEKEGDRLRGLFGKKQQGKEHASTLQNAKSKSNSRSPALWSQDGQTDAWSRNLDLSNRELNDSGDDRDIFGSNFNEDGKQQQGSRVSPGLLSHKFALGSPDDETGFNIPENLPPESRNQRSVLDGEIVAERIASPPKPLYADSKDWMHTSSSPDTPRLPKDGSDQQSVPYDAEPTFETSVLSDGPEQRPASPSTRSKLASLFTKKSKDKSSRVKDDARFASERDIEYNRLDTSEESSCDLPGNSPTLSPNSLVKTSTRSQEAEGLERRTSSDIAKTELPSSPCANLEYASTRYTRGKRMHGENEFYDDLGRHSPSDQPRSDLPLTPPREKFERSIPETPVFASEISDQERNKASLKDDAYDRADIVDPNSSSYDLRSEETTYETSRPDESVRSPSHALLPEQFGESESASNDLGLSNAERQYQDAFQSDQRDDRVSRPPAVREGDRSHPVFGQGKDSSSQFVDDLSLPAHDNSSPLMSDHAAPQPLSGPSSPSQSELSLLSRRSLDLTACDEDRPESAVPADGNTSLGNKLRNWLKKSDNNDETRSDKPKYSSATRKSDRSAAADHSLADVSDREIEQGK